MRNLSCGILLGIVLLVLFAIAAGFVQRTIASKTEPGELTGDEIPAVVVRFGWQEWKDLLLAVLSTCLIWGMIAFGALYWRVYLSNDQSLQWNIIAGVALATIFGVGTLAMFAATIKIIGRWFWFKTCSRNRTEAKVLFIGERTIDELDNLRSCFSLSYSYSASAAVAPTYVAHEEISARECERLKNRQTVKVEYACANPKFIRRV